MLGFEWKKLLVNRHGLWLIVAFLLAELLGTLLLTQPYDRTLEENRGVYDSYLAPMIGALTPEKREALEAEMERLDGVHQDMEQLKRDYYAGKVSEETYRSDFAALLKDDQLYPGFSKLYSQYIFVREQENRSFLYTGGWEALLTDQEPDYLFLLLLIVVLSPIFCEEYASRMNEILLTQKHSARHQVGVKLCVALTLTGALTAILQGMELVYCAARFGLPNGEFTLQSLVSFGKAAKPLSLWQAFWLQFALKEVGYCYAAIWILFLSVWLKKYALTLMAGICVLTLPFLTVESNDVFLRIPAPWALTLGSIYLNGSKTYTDSKTGQQLTRVAELSVAEIAVFIGIVALIAGCMVIFIRSRNTNYQMKRSKRLGALALACAAAGLLSGCTPEAEPVIFNSSTAGWCESGQYVLLSTQFKTILIDQETGKEYPFPADAFAEETVFNSSSFFCANGYAYYVRETRLHPTAGFDSIIAGSDALMRLDLGTMSEEVCYPWNTESSWFFGLLDRESTEASLMSVNTFFIHRNDLYFMADGDLVKMNLTTGQYETYLEDLNAQDFAYDGRNLYYVDAYSRLVMHDLERRENHPLDQVITEKFLLTPEGIYFLNRKDQNTLYHWDAQKGQVVKLDDTSAYALYYDAEYLWVVERGNGTLHRLNHDGTGEKTAQLDGSICCIGPGEKLYYYGFQSDTICALDKQTFGDPS